MWEVPQSDPHQLLCEPMFVIMIDDVDLQVERIRELLTGASPALSSQCRIPRRRSLGTPDRHTGNWTSLDSKIDSQTGQPDRNAWYMQRIDDKWAGTLAIAAASKVFPLKKSLDATERAYSPRTARVSRLWNYDSDELADGQTGACSTMGTMLDAWPRTARHRRPSTGSSVAVELNGLE